MSRPAKALLILSASIAVAALATACGTERIGVSKSSPLHAGAVLFSQRCSGCHTLAYAATRGSAANARTREVTNGPNFDVRCERPVTRVLYAIENGGFSGGIMPQNVVVGQDAIEVAKFVATYAGTKAPVVTGVTPCNQRSIGTVPTAATSTSSSMSSSTASTSSTATTSTSNPSAGKGANGGRRNAGAGNRRRPNRGPARP